MYNGSVTFLGCKYNLGPEYIGQKHEYALYFRIRKENSCVHHTFFDVLVAYAPVALVVAKCVNSYFSNKKK